MVGPKHPAAGRPPLRQQIPRTALDHGTDTSPERSLERLDSLPEASFDAANKHVDTCLPNTRRDILAQIRRWADGDGGQRIYWLKGWAGTCKSTIALTVAREYSAKKRLGASFFFSRGGGDLSHVTGLGESPFGTTVCGLNVCRQRVPGQSPPALASPLPSLVRGCF
jgi:hypothetical protein